MQNMKKHISSVLIYFIDEKTTEHLDRNHRTHASNYQIFEVIRFVDII